MIDTRAVIDPSARIADNVTIGPYSVIGPDVEIGEGTVIGPHVVINGPTTIGRENKIFQFASIGEEPQDKKYAGEKTRLEIGDRNIIRECVTINRGTVQGGGVTKIKDDNLLMAYVHVAHDCDIGSQTIFANNASLAGHVTVHDYAILSGFVAVHQFAVIGAYSFIARATMVPRDVLAYLFICGHDAAPYGLNTEGLKRRGFSAETIMKLRRAYKVIYRNGLSVPDAIAKLEEMVVDCPEIQLMIDGLKATVRGIIR